MNRCLSSVNFAGVVLLSAVCVVQWASNRRISLEGIALERTRLELAAKVDEQAMAIENSRADAEGFRNQLAKASAGWKESREGLTASQTEIRALIAERDALKAGAEAWKAALAARDQRLKESAQALLQAASERDAAIVKFNALAEKHNAVVGQLNDALLRLAALQTNSSVGTLRRQ